MEDAHAVSLNLDEHPDEADSNTFFAVYDGHGGTETHFDLCSDLSESNTGSSVARFAGQNVHRRLIQEESYGQQDYKEAMRRAFLGTDEDMLAGALYSPLGYERADLDQILHIQEILPDAPRCLLWLRRTKFLWYRRSILYSRLSCAKPAIALRQTLVTPGLYLA